jgi:hypothetical protein
VEHHLLPRLPRHNLRYAMDQYIIPFAQRHGLPYHSFPFIEANRRVFDSLRDAAYKARALPDSTPASTSFLYQFLNADG